MVTMETERETPTADTQASVTRGHLLAIALLGCFTAAIFGAAPLAAWVDASIMGETAVAQTTQAWLGLTQRIGLDRPYDAVRRAVRAAEAARFGGDN
jgi:hypothetical protein